MEEKRVYCWLATRIPGPTWFFWIYKPPSLKKCTKDFIPTSEPFLLIKQVMDYSR